MFELGSSKFRWAVLEEGQPPVLQCAEGSVFGSESYKTIPTVPVWKCGDNPTVVNLTKPGLDKSKINAMFGPSKYQCISCVKCNSTDYYILKNSSTQAMCAACGEIYTIEES